MRKSLNEMEPSTPLRDEGLVEDQDTILELTGKIQGIAK